VCVCVCVGAQHNSARSIPSRSSAEKAFLVSSNFSFFLSFLLLIILLLLLLISLSLSFSLSLFLSLSLSLSLSLFIFLFSLSLLPEVVNARAVEPRLSKFSHNFEKKECLCCVVANETTMLVASLCPVD